MTVAELIEALLKMPPDLLIAIRTDLNDTSGEFETILVTQEWDEAVIEIV